MALPALQHITVGDPDRQVCHMNWTFFYVTFAIAFLLSGPTFAVLNHISMKAGQVPTAGVRDWHGRTFVQWKEETNVFIGDMFFYSLLDAVVACGILQVHWTTGAVRWAAGTLCVFPLLATAGWIIDATKRYSNRSIPTWGWHWTGPDARWTGSAYYHAVYFFIQACATTIALAFLVWRPEVSVHLKAGMMFSLVGYVMCFVHFMTVQKARGLA